MKGRLIKDVKVPGVNMDEWDTLPKGTKVEITREWCSCDGPMCQCALESGREVILSRSAIEITDHRPYVDWEQRRYEIAKDCLNILSAAPDLGRYETIVMSVDLAITYADELIKQLKK